jgi:hypothetical protein
LRFFQKVQSFSLFAQGSNGTLEHSVNMLGENLGVPAFGEGWNF